jgi:exodeoxyribonuclease-3
LRTRIATWDVNSLMAKLPQVLDWLGEHRADASCLQDLKLEDAPNGFRILAQRGGAHCAWRGQRRPPASLLQPRRFPKTTWE